MKNDPPLKHQYNKFVENYVSPRTMSGSSAEGFWGTLLKVSEKLFQRYLRRTTQKGFSEGFWETLPKDSRKLFRRLLGSSFEGFWVALSKASAKLSRRLLGSSTKGF